MKEYKEGKQKTATMVNKRRLSPPSIYEGPLSTSPLHSIARPPSPSLPRLPSSDRLSESPLHVFDFSPFEPRRSSKRAPFLGRPLRPQDPLSSSREGNHGGGGEGRPRFEQFLLALTLCPPKGGKKKKKKKEKKGKKKLAETAFFSSCEKSLYLDGDPFENVSPVKKIGPWPAVGFRIIGEKRNLERWKVEMGGGGWRGTSRRENRNGGRVGRFVGPILLDAARLFDKWCRVESIEIGRNEKYSVFFEINEEEF